MGRRGGIRTTATGWIPIAFVVGGLVASMLNSSVFAGYVAMGAAVGAAFTFNSVKQLPRSFLGLVILLTAAFPLLSMQLGEAGVYWASAASVVLLLSAFVFEGRTAGAVHNLSVCLLVIIGSGVFPSYLVLIRLGLGIAPLNLYALALAGFALGSLLAEYWLPEDGQSNSPGGGRWVVVAAGLAGCELGTVLGIVLLQSYLPVVSLCILGLVVGAATILAESVERMVLSDLGSPPAAGQGAWEGRFRAFLYAAPIFFYCYRLLLT
jgi:hypothetical protein